MIVKKSGKSIVGAQLTVAERKALEIEARKILVELHSAYFRDIDAMVLYTLNQEFGFAASRLHRFYKAFQQLTAELRDRYEESEILIAANAKLHELGVDLKSWESAENEDIVLT